MLILGMLWSEGSSSSHADADSGLVHARAMTAVGSSAYCAAGMLLKSLRAEKLPR